ncbi:conjugative transposon protein TraN [Spirosoma sordidisoli]|uniref:Conjugative transposon protein TraN n=1 Tax=Spirosoma sordidisoli TaxID=2502893 RepID=A0A4Q2UGY3_9BACT|nr:conjugative transposon protein TraN [Spirosoma sordidisoli]RYC66695.1 conjugative transposon protein TraN [Spirosoma sordidisoli]
MTRLILLYFLAFSAWTAHAQSVKATKATRAFSSLGKPVRAKTSLYAAIQPLAVKGISSSVPSIPSAVTTPMVVQTSSKQRDEKTLNPANPTVNVANPALVGSIRTKPYLLPIDRAAVRGSYPLGISDRKTTHIIFPARIQEFDAGTDYVLAQIPETVRNVLRIKANPKATAFCRADSGRETNMTVMTEDGGFYSFLVRYQDEPEVLNINMANNLSADEYTSRTLGINRATTITLTASATATNGTPPVSDLLYQCQRIADRKAFIRNIGASTMRISNLLTGIYVADKVMYMQFTIRNDSQIDYEVDFVKFYVRDKDVLKRMAAQEVELKPHAHYPESFTLLRAKAERTVVYALPVTTITEDKIIDVELYEKNGGRHLRYQIEADVVLLAKPL